jgi:hypothetical protein
MKNDTYNGWTNRSTWNLVLWISNDAAAYDHFDTLYSRMHSHTDEKREEAVRAAAFEWFGHTTPDGDELDEVNWEEVRVSLDEDFEQYLVSGDDEGIECDDDPYYRECKAAETGDDMSKADYLDLYSRMGMEGDY